MKDLKQADNKCYIEGILSENNLEEKTSTKDGKTTEYIGGSIVVRVDQEINGEAKILEIPVNIYASKYKKDGNPNPSYTSIKNVKDNFISIASGAGVEKATKVKMTAEIMENAYYSQKEELVRFPRIRTSFVNEVKGVDFSPKANFNVTICVLGAHDEVDQDGIETGRYIVTGGIVQYGNKLDVVDFVANSPAVIDAVKTYFENGKSYRISGKINFTSEIKTFKQELDFGEADERTITTHVSELIIVGGSQSPLEGDFDYDPADIKTAVDERNLRIEKTKEKKPVEKATDFSGFGF